VATKSSKAGLGVFVALLRGVNVGGNNMISMSSLKKSFEAMGFAQVTTYINSGNIIFKTKENDARKLESKIEKMLLKEYQLDSRVVVRTLAEMAKLVKSLPASWSTDTEWRYNVMFLRHSIDSEKIVAELPIKNDIERLEYRPGALLWSAKATNLAQTSMAKISSLKIFRDVTVRNLNTTKKLHDLMTKLAETGT
jgi:uncharacterized protein (DUF1697 family)